MIKIISLCCLLISANIFAQQPLMMPQNIKKAFTNETRSADGKPGKKYWQNHGDGRPALCVAQRSRGMRHGGAGVKQRVNYASSPRRARSRIRAAAP